jgi:biotin synthase-related radical SAM superfamily protein
MIVYTYTHCINTYPEGCRVDCACCGQVRHREETCDYADRNLIRVDWPAVHHEEIIARVKKSEGNEQFERMCISRISHPDSHDDVFVYL